MKKTLFICILFFAQLQSSFAFDFFFTEAKRSHIYSTGSSTISPLMASVSEEFSRVQSKNGTPVKTPIVMSTGTRSGFKSFCKGIGYNYPDFVNASRAIEESEIEECRENNIKNIIEIKIGYDGIVFGNSIKAPKTKLSEEHIFLALAEKVLDKKTGKLIDNPFETWNQIDAKLPKTKITIYGPPLSSGTRDVFMDMLVSNICFHKEEFIRNYPDTIARKNQCHKIRNDGKFIESGENDNLIVDNLEKDLNAIGIFGFNFIFNNQKAIKAVEIDGVLPNLKTISSRKYPFSRPLFIYFKKEHLNLIPKLPEFIAEIINPETIGEKGYLVNSGLVPMKKEELEIVRKNIAAQLNEK